MFLASPKFFEIIQEIKDMGFYKGATYIEPNQLEIAVNNLKKGLNDKAYIKRSYRLLHDLLKRLRGERQQNFYDVLDAYGLIKSNDFSNYQSKTKNKKILELLKHYTIKREDIKDVKEKDLNYKKTKHYFDRLIKENQFKDLTLTYDFEAEVAKIKRTASI